jgi:hypothetical protein
MEDRNKNLVVDSRSESFGFLADTLDLQQNIKNVKIPIIRLDTRPLKISSARPYNTYFNIKTTKNTTRFTLKGDTTEFFVTSYGEDQANVRVYNTFENIDSIAVRFTATDSINNVTDSLLYLKFTSRQVKPESFIVKPENLQVIGTKGLLRGTIRFSKPLLQINYDSLFYRIDSTQHIPITAADIQWDTLRNILQFEKQFNKSLLTVKPDTAAKKSKPELTKVGVSSTPSDKRMPAPKPINNQYYFAKGSFISIELDTSKLISESVKPSKQEETGIIFIEINTEEPSFILQLLDKNFAVLNSLRNKKKASFEDLPPGDYQLRLVIDRDKNGRWSPGNYFKKIEPEPVMFYKNEKGNTTISLKANWELGPLLIKY